MNNEKTLTRETVKVKIKTYKTRRKNAGKIVFSFRSSSGIGKIFNEASRDKR